MDIGRRKRLPIRDARVKDIPIKLAVGGHLGTINHLFHNSSHKTQGQKHSLLVTERFMVVQRRQYFRGGKAHGTCLIIEYLQTGGNEIAGVAHRHFVLPVE